MKDSTKLTTEELKNGLVNSLNIVSSIFTSGWSSMMSVLHLVVYSYLLFALLNYYELNYSSIESFVGLLRMITNNWVLFWWVFFIINLWSDYYNRGGRE